MVKVPCFWIRWTYFPDWTASLSLSLSLFLDFELDLLDCLVIAVIPSVGFCHDGTFLRQSMVLPTAL